MRRRPGALRRCACALALAAAVAIVTAAAAQEGRFLSLGEAPAAVFPGAEFERAVVPSTEPIRQGVRAALGGVDPSIWEVEYPVFTANRAGAPVGCAVIVEEIGKHRPITFVVGVGTDGTVVDVAVMEYREAYGGEVRNKRFLGQYRDKTVADGLRPYGEIKNIAGATLSVEAASRAVKKALAVASIACRAGAGS